MTLNVTISNNPVVISDKSIENDNTIDGRSTLKFDVLDPTGTANYQFAQPVSLIDTVTGDTFNGYINDTVLKNQNPNANNVITITCVDGEYVPGKRYYVGPEYTNMYAGDIIVDLVNKELASEGITSAYAVDSDRSQSAFSEGSLNGVVAANNVSGGDLELAPAGTQVQIVESTTSDFSTGTLTLVSASNNALVASPVMAIKISGTMNVPGLTNTIASYKIWQGSYTVTSSDFFEYYVWIDPTSAENKAAINLIFSDGTTLFDLATNYNVDENDLSPIGSTDLSGYANGMWYHRQFGIGNTSGKTLSYITVNLSGAQPGNYTAYFKYIDILGGTVFYNGTSLQSSQLVKSIGYSNISLNAVNTYSLQPYQNNSAITANLDYYSFAHERVSPSYSINAVNILKNSFISWNATEPANTKTVVRYALDNGPLIECVNNAALPGLIPGVNINGRSITFYEDLYRINGASPEDAPTLNSLEVTLNPSFACIKQDQSYKTSFLSSETGATFTSVVGNSSILNLIGTTHNWNDGTRNNQTDYLGGAGATVFQRSYQFGNPSAGNESKSRFDFAGQVQNFTTEIDVQVKSDISIGLFYRSTNLSSNNGSYAYAVMISATTLALKRGTNTTGGGSATTINSVTVSLSDGSWHRIKVVVNGNSHSVYLDDILFFTSTSTTFPNTGYLGAYGVSPTQAYPQFNFNNFGVMPALSGTWISPAISLNSVATYGNSYISWRDRSESPAASNAISVLVSLDGGSTYAQCANGAPLPSALFTPGLSLVGKSILIQINMLTSTVTKMPGIDNLGLLITGSYSASGNRTSEALTLAPVGRAGSTLVSWNAIVPPNTTFAIDTSLDFSTWTQIGTGATGSAPIAGITTQAEPMIDKFTSDTSRNYTSTSRSGGATATATIDTANSRLVLVGGTNALYLYNSPTTASDFDLSAILDRSDSGGFLWRYQDQRNYYGMQIADASSATNPNTVQIYKVVANSRTNIATASISFTRGTPHTFRIIVMTTNITVSMDGNNVITTTDSSITAAGYCGLQNNGGTSQYYLFRVQAFGDDVTAKQVFSRARFTSTDASVSAQLTSLTMSVRNPNIQNGAFYPSTSISVLNGSNKTLAQIIDDFAKESNFWWRIVAGQLYFQAHSSTIAPFPITSADVLAANAEIDAINDQYRNLQWGTGGKDIVQLAPVAFIGNGVDNSFDVGYPIDSVSSITVNGITQNVGIKGADTGKDWYYKQGDSSVVQDASAIRLIDSQTLVVTCAVQADITCTVRRDADIARIAALDNTTGIIEWADDMKGANKSTIIVKLDGLLNQFCVNNAETVKFTTLRSGLAVGQLISLFVSPFGLFDGTFIITSVKITWQNTANGTKAWYDIECTNGGTVGDWTRFVSNLAVLGG